MARFRWPVFAVALAAVVAAGVWGMGVFGQLTEGGYNDPGSESTRASEVVQEALGARGGDVVVIYTPAGGSIDDAVLAQRVENRLAALPRDAVTGSTSYWQAKAPQYASEDRRSAVAVLTLAGADDAGKLAAYREIADRLGVEGARTQLAGGAALADATTTRSTRDLAVAETISLPIVLVLLLFFFGSLVAAALPVIVGGAAVLGSLGVLHAVASGHDVNSFAVNVASLLGLGMAIDYGLFMVGRFREEQSYGRTPAEAVTRTVATAGRTVLFSATLLMIALAGLLLFPQGFLKSLAYGGLASVALAAILSLTLLPALLAILGPRVDKLPVRLPGRGADRPAGTGWARLADVVLRRPVLVALPILAGLLVLAAPIRGVTFGEADERVLPAAEPARQAIERLKADFPALSSSGIQVVLRGATAGADTFVESLRKVPGVAEVTPAGAARGVTVFTATPRDTDPFSTGARDTVRDIRALQPPPGGQVLVGGTTARNVDSLDATADRLPLMIALLAGATLLLMFLAFGSVLLPVKAVVMSALSLAATFGILVWIFQDGHGAGLLDITPAPPEVGIVVLMAAVVFGLSTDYEVFLLSRMVEARTRGATTPEAVTTGLARTGRVISAAALLLIVVTGAFALSSVTTMRFVGVGMIIALVLDATVVRMLLVPAVLGLMGDAAWWAPGPLRRLQEKAGLAEYEDEELFPTVSVGRHAAPGEAVARSSGTSRPRHASPEPVEPPVRAAAGRELAAAAAPASAAAASPAPLVAATAPAAAPAASSPPPSSPGPASPGPSSPAPASPAPSLSAPSSAAASSTDPSPGGPASPGPASPAPSSPAPASPGSPASPGPPSVAPGSAPASDTPAAGGPGPVLPPSPASSAAASPAAGSPVSGGGASPVPSPPASAPAGLATGKAPAPVTASAAVPVPPSRPTAGVDPSPARVPTGEHAPARPSTRTGTSRTGPAGPPPGDSRADAASGEQPSLRRTTGGQQAVAAEAGSAPDSFPARSQAPVRSSTGEQTAVQPATGHRPTPTPGPADGAAAAADGGSPADRPGTGDHPPIPPGPAPQPTIRPGTGEHPPVQPTTGGARPARPGPGPGTGGQPSAPDPAHRATTPPAGGAAARGTGTGDPDPTLNLAGRMTDRDDPDPDVTAVLEADRIADLSARRERG